MALREILARPLINEHVVCYGDQSTWYVMGTKACGMLWGPEHVVCYGDQGTWYVIGTRACGMLLGPEHVVCYWDQSM